MNTNRKSTGWYLTPHLLLLISTAIYFAPFFVGSFEYITPMGHKVQRSYSSETGLAVFLVLALVFLAAFLRKHRVHRIVVSRTTSMEAATLLAMIGVFGLYVIYSGHYLAQSKQEMLDQTNRLHLIFYQLCSLGMIFCFIAGAGKHKLLLAASALGLLMIVYFGHRSVLLIALIGCAYVKFHQTNVPKVKWSAAIAFLLLIFALVVYKSVYSAVKDGRWELVLERISPENLWQSAIVGMEQFTTFAHLDFMVSADFALECSNAWMIPVTIFPFSDQFIGALGDFESCGYNAQVQPAFFSGYTGGVAANIWAEFYGYFGYVGFPLLVLVLSAFFWLIEALMQKVRSPVVVAGLVVALVNMSFYIQRKELLGGFVSAKRALTIAVIVFIIAWFLSRFQKRDPGALQSLPADLSKNTKV